MDLKGRVFIGLQYIIHIVNSLYIAGKSINCRAFGFKGVSDGKTKWIGLGGMHKRCRHNFCGNRFGMGKLGV